MEEDKWRDLEVLDAESKKNIYNTFYERIAPGSHRCLVCAANNRKKQIFSFAITKEDDGKNGGYHNSMAHVASSHSTDVAARLEGYLQTIKKKNIITNYLPKKISKGASDIYAWMRLVIMEDLPFNSVEHQTFHEICKYDPISRTTFMKYVQFLLPPCSSYPCCQQATSLSVFLALPNQIAFFQKIWIEYYSSDTTATDGVRLQCKRVSSLLREKSRRMT